MNKIQKEHIEERMKFYAQDIDNYAIDDVVIDIDGVECVVTNKTLNSIEIHLDKKCSEGVSCKQWFTMNDYNRRFKRK